MNKQHTPAPYHSTCQYYGLEPKKSTLYCGVPLYIRKKDKSYYIMQHGRRVNVVIVNAYGVVARTDGRHFDNPLGDP